MMNRTRTISAALVFCLLCPATEAWGQQTYAHGSISDGPYPASTAAHVPYGMLPQSDPYLIPTAHLFGGNPGQRPSGAPAPDGTPPAAVPDAGPDVPDFGDFQEQSATFASATYAASPSMIGDMFGGGSTTAIIGSVMPFSFSAQGDYIAGLPGDTSATIAFDVSPPNGSADFFSVGPALTPDGRRFAITEPVPPSNAPTPTAPGFTFEGGTATNSSVANPTIGNLQLWDVAYSYSNTRSIAIPTPGSSVVGRMKIAENASPLPRDRVFVNYSLFDNVPLQAGGVTVNRITPGFEKTSPRNQDSSVEVRFPFASTLSSNIVSDGATAMGNIEFGNIFVTYKRVFEKSDNWLVSGGTSLSIPTASDLSVAMADGTQLVRVENRSVRVMPFVAGLATLGDRMFAHGFMQFDFDTSGNPVQLNFTGSGLEQVGRVQETNFLYLDMGMGYWFRRPGECPDAFFTSIVPTLELHINRSLQRTDVIAAGPFRIGQSNESIQLDSFVVGGTLGMVGQNSLTVGYAIPFGNGTDQAFDGELRAFWNRFF